MPPIAFRQEKYDSRNPVVGFVIRRFFDRIGRVLRDLDPQTVLDAGCGEGELVRRGVLGREVATVGLDLRLSTLAGRAPELPPCVCGSVLALPFASRSFDVVLCLEVLEHLADPAAAFRELSRVARKGVVVSVPHEPYFRIGNVLRGKHLARLGDHPEHVQHWNPRTLHTLLASSAGDVQMLGAFPWLIACCRP